MPLFEGSVVPTGDPGRTGPHDTSGTTFSDFQFLVFAKTHSACPLCPRQLTFPNGLAWPLCAKRKTGNIVWIKIIGGYQLRLPNRDTGGASRLLPSHTTVHTGPYTAVRWIELTPVPAGGGAAGVWRRASARTLRSLHHRAVGLHPSVMASRPATTGVLPHGAIEMRVSTPHFP